MFGDLEESLEGNAGGQENFRDRILSKEMAGAQMEKERGEGKTRWEDVGRKSQSSAMGWEHWPKTRWLPARCLPQEGF